MMSPQLDDKTIAADLLNGVKATIKDTAIALTETATPAVHRALQRQLNEALGMHEQLVSFMTQKGWYKPYDVTGMVQADLQATQQLQSNMGQQYKQSQIQYGQPIQQPQYQPPVQHQQSQYQPPQYR